MFDDTAQATLNKPLIARLSTIGEDGYPHSVPIWFMYDGQDILFISDRSARKTQNAMENAKGAVTVGGDSVNEDGYLIRGDFTVEDDLNKQVTNRMIDRYESKESAAQLKELWKDDDMIVIRLQPKSVVKVH